MGFFDSIRKKNENANWVINKKPTQIVLTDTHIQCISVAKEFNIFYADIRNIEKQAYQLKIETSVDSYKITPRKLKDRHMSDELYQDITEKISEIKK